MLSVLADTLIAKVINEGENTFEKAQTTFITDLEFADKHKATMSAEKLTQSAARELMDKIVDKCTEKPDEAEDNKSKTGQDASDNEQEKDIKEKDVAVASSEIFEGDNNAAKEETKECEAA